MNNIFFILLSVLLNASAQILMRKGMLKLGGVSMASFFKTFPALITNVFLWLSLVCYGLSYITWMMVLSKVEVSFAYPFLSLGFVLVTVLGYFFLGEKITYLHIIGIAFICIGVVFISRV